MKDLIVLNFKRFKSTFISFILLFFAIIVFISLSLSAINGYSTYFENQKGNYSHLNYIYIEDSKLTDNIIKDNLQDIDYYMYHQKEIRDLSFKKINSFVYSKDISDKYKFSVSSFAYDELPSEIKTYYETNNPLLVGSFPKNNKEIVLSSDLLLKLSLPNDTTEKIINRTISLTSPNTNQTITNYKIVGILSHNYQFLNSSNTDALLYKDDPYFTNNTFINNRYLFVSNFEDDDFVLSTFDSYRIKKGYGLNRYLKLLSIQEFINSVLLIIFMPITLGILFLFTYSFINIYKTLSRTISIELTSGINKNKIILSFAIQIFISLFVALFFGEIISSILLLIIKKILDSFSINLIFNYGLNITIGILIFVISLVILVFFLILLITYLKKKHIFNLLKTD